MKKRKWLGILGMMVIMMSMFLGGCAGASKLSDKFDEETVKAEAMKTIELFNERNYQGIIDMGSDELKASITADVFSEQCDPYLNKDGAFKEISKTVVMGNENSETGESYGGVVMVGEYENGKIQFTIGFDEEMKLIQFNIK